MNIVVNEDLKAYIDPLTPDEHEALERSILAEGCRDALVLWGEVLVDGHNRYGICQKHSVPFQTVQNPRFQSIEDVHMWMIDQHLGRRSVSDFQRGVLALRKKEILQERCARAAVAASQGGADVSGSGDVGAGSANGGDVPNELPAPAALSSREAIAKAARISSGQVVMIEKIQKQAAPEVLAAVKSGTISINAAAAVATLPQDEQAAAAQGGADELKLAAKRVRDAKRKVREETAAAAEDRESAAADEVEGLRQRVAELTAENEALRRQVATLLARAA